MKKFLTALTTILAVVVMAFALTACSSNVSGKTYVFDEVRIELPDDAPDILKTAAEKLRTETEESSKNIEVTFNADGTVSGNGGLATGTWEQDGNTVTINSVTPLTVKGSKLEQSMEMGNYKIVLVLKKK